MESKSWQFRIGSPEDSQDEATQKWLDALADKQCLVKITIEKLDDGPPLPASGRGSK
jgi:hypothetical protein